MNLQRVLNALPAYGSFFKDPVRHWADLSRLTSALAPMIGIETPVWLEAVKKVGAEAASVAVLFVLENLARIENPGGYFRRMVQNHAGQGADLALSLVSRAENAGLSADNRNCLSFTNG